MSGMNSNFSRYKNAFILIKQGFGAYRYQIILLAILGLTSGLLESIGINAIIPLLSFIIGSGPTADLDFISSAIQSLFVFLHIPFQFRYLLVFIVVLFVLKAVVLFIITYITVKITAGYEREVRSKLFKETLDARWGYLLKQKLGYLETVLMTSVKLSSETLERFSMMIILLTGLLVYAAVALSISYNVTIFTLVLGGIIFLLFKPILYRARMTSAQILKATRNVAHYTNENILGLKTIKVTSSEKDVKEHGDELFTHMYNLRIRSTLLRSIGNVLIQPIGLIFISIVFAFSFKMDTFVLSSFIAVVYLIQRIFTHFQKLQTNVHKLSESAPYLKNVIDYSTELEQNKEKKEGTGRVVFEDKLAFKNVAFAYGDLPVLRNVSFEIKKGDMVGLIGPSGSGKTTIVDLMLRLFSPHEGSITVDGKDIRDVSLTAWRNGIAYVSQDMFLQNGTIAENIRFYDSSISDEDIRVAAQAAHILEFIEQTEDGFETEIGERGILLSAGQRQRVVLARALVRKPQFLILDEATSALDNESESQIQKVIEELRGRVTVFVVAHRLSTIENATKLLVLKDGEIVEEGDPKDLLKDTDSYFYKAYNIRK